MTIYQWLDNSTNLLHQAGIDSARLDSLLLLGHVLTKPKSWLLANQHENTLSDEQISNVDQLLKRRILREPIAYIIGSVEFYGLDFKVDQNVLIPRPETEIIVSTVIDLASTDDSVLDIGTGSGAIAISVKTTRDDLHVTASDISESALKKAKRNASDNSIHDIKFVQSNLMDDIIGEFNIITANLPYVSESKILEPEINYEPKHALFAPDNGFGLYGKLFMQVSNHLAYSGILLIEADPHQFIRLISEARDHRLTQAADISKGLMLAFRKSS